MVKAREAFQPDMLMFTKDILTFQDPDAGFSMVTYKKRNTLLDEIHSARIRFGDEKGASVTVRFLGYEKGKRAIFKHATDFVVTATDDHSIVVTDPDLGELRYQSEIGLLGGIEAE